MRWLLLALLCVGCAELPSAKEKEEELQIRKKRHDAECEEWRTRIFDVVKVSTEEDKKYTESMLHWLNTNLDDPDIVQWISKEYSRCKKYGTSKTEILVKIRVIDSQGIKKIHEYYFIFDFDKIQNAYPRYTHPRKITIIPPPYLG
jgi:hypothetical protein